MPTNDWLPTFSFQDILQGEDLSLTEDFSNQNSALEFFEKEGSSVLENQKDQETFYVDVSKRCQPPPQPETEPELPKSRFGRTLKPPSFYQA